MKTMWDAIERMVWLLAGMIICATFLGVLVALIALALEFPGLWLIYILLIIFYVKVVNSSKKVN